MSEFENTPADPADTEMAGAETSGLAEAPEAPEGSAPAEGEEAEAGAELPFAEGPGEEARRTFVDYLSSPVVSLLVGPPGSEKVLTAHQALLVKSPYFKDVCATFADDGSVSLSLLSPNHTRTLSFSSARLDIAAPLALLRRGHWGG